MKPILEVKNISKKFNINHNHKSYLSLRDSLSNVFNKKNEKDKEFWALQNVSFDIYPGDSIGIIGKNGAGKSTLLKILSKITPPTSGKIISRGRIASLLEVGTGFHPELTGRENIYLNGSILGLKKTEINKQFDNIIDFSGIEKFLDTSLKHYSSGMQLRLAFAVAAHLEPEILIIDEVLAVGDVEFQKKCMGKMNEVSKSGRTILLVSHNISSIQSLSTKAIFLSKGTTNGIVSIDEAVHQYLYGELNTSATFIIESPDYTKPCYIKSVRLLNNKNEITERFKSSDEIKIEIEWINNDGVSVNPNFLLINQYGINVIQSVDTMVDLTGSKKNKKGAYVSTVIIPKYFLNVGDYFFHIALDNAAPRICYDFYLSCLHMTVWESLDEINPVKGNYTNLKEDCAVVPLLNWDYQIK